MGMVYEGLKNWGMALTYYYKAIELRRNYPSDSSDFDYYYENLAIVAYKQNRIEEFLTYFERSGDLNNEPEKKAIVYNRLGVLYYEDRKEKIALEYYRKAFDCDASKPVYNSNIGLAYEQLGEWENALTFYRKALELRRNYPNDKYGFDFYYENLAKAFYMLGRIDEFIEYFEKSDDLNNDPSKKAIVYNRIGILFYNYGKSKNAEEYYNKAIECDDKKAVFHSNMGLLYTGLGQWNKALPYYEKAVELRINYPDDEYSLEYYNGLLEEATRNAAIIPN
jgi:tetratricopeptide (TPR) repeat protein